MSHQICRVVHSQSKPAWNIVGTVAGGPFKIARFPYVADTGSEVLDTEGKAEALERAQFCAWCINNRERVESIRAPRPRTA